MYNFINNQKGKIPFKMVALGLAGVLVLVGVIGVIGRIGEIGEMNNKGDILDIRIPVNYTQPLVIAIFDNFLSIKPVKANSSKMIKTGENTIKYIDAYKNTDVEQIKYPNKLKESLILKNKNHPDRFEYEINVDDYLWEINRDGDILFKQKEYEERFEIDEIKDGHIKATMNTDYTDGHPVIFKIPAPYLIDADGNKSSKDFVKVEIEKNKLILIPDKKWLNSHSYPIILDPTVEKVTPENEKIIFGDENLEDFKPKMKLHKWGDETFVSLEYEPMKDDGYGGKEKKKGKLKIKDKKIAWEDDEGEIDVEMYYKEAGEVDDEQGVEFDLILNQNPGTNVFDYKLNSQDLDFYYQPPLNEENNSYPEPEIDYCTETECFNNEGQVVTYRPENLVGSYAVYHSEKSGDYTQLGGKNYKAGKAFHIYRPKVYDTNGDWVWGEMNINQDNSILSITVNQDWLDNAVYPVVIDPIFGYESIGGSNNYQGGGIGALALQIQETSPAGSNTLNYITFYTQQPGNGYTPVPARFGLYTESGGAPSSLVSSDASTVNISTAGWYTNPTDLDYSLAASTQYWAAFSYTDDLESPQMFSYYDGGGSNSDRYGGTTVLPNPWSGASSDFSSSVIFSVYITYSAANATPSISSVTDSPDPVNAGNVITFSTDWVDADADELGKIKICKSDSLTNQVCDGGHWASSTDFVAEGAVELTYTAQSGDVAGSPNNYFAFVCDDEAACVASGSGTAGTFSVNATPGAPVVTDTPDPTNPGRSVTFIIDWDDSGDSVKAKVCKAAGLTNQICDSGHWASSTDFTTTDPLSLKYDIIEADWGQTRNYYVFTCDDGAECSTSSSGSFSVNAVSTVPDIKIRGGTEIRGRSFR